MENSAEKITPSNETCPAELPNFCAKRHWSIFLILIVCSVAMVTGRVMTVRNHSARGDSPFFSANDRSRWCTIRALGDEGSYEIDDVIRRDQSIDWDTIDKVQHVGRDGRMHYYSSKPTLLPTLLAYGYRALKSVTGKGLESDPLFVVRVMLILVNVLPWAVFLYFLAKTINAVPVRDWARYYVLACAGFGTFLSTYCNTLNNHLPAAVSVMIALYLISVIWQKEKTHWAWFFACGLFAAFAAANELPALAFFAFVGLLCGIKSPPKAILGFGAGAILVGVGFFGTNYLAHGQWKPAYAHRGDGEMVASVTGDFWESLDRDVLPVEIRNAAAQQFDFTDLRVEQDGWPSTPSSQRRWVVRDRVSATQFAIVNQAVAPGDGDPFTSEYEIRKWGNWYDYPGSYWSRDNEHRKSAVDRGQPQLDLYAFHVLFGHHGIFSLTPIWLLSLGGMIALVFGAKIAGRFQMRWLGWMGLSISVVVLAFYIFGRPPMDRNYGGVTSGLRWVFWLAPIWLVSMLPVVDWLARTRKGQFICFVLLAMSAMSAFYSLENPWVHPWLYEIWDWTGLER